MTNDDNVELNWSESYNRCKPSSPIRLSDFGIILIYISFIYSHQCLPLRSNDISEWLYFNALFITNAPKFPIKLPINFIKLTMLYIVQNGVKTQITTQIQWSECTISLECFTYHSCFFCSNPIICSFHLSFFLSRISSLFFFIFLYSRFLSVTSHI